VLRCFKAGTHASHIRPIFGKYYGDPDLPAAAAVDIEDWTFNGWRDWEQAFARLPAEILNAYGG
jgi:hypothetical protein